MHTMEKMKSKWIKELNVTHRGIKLLEETQRKFSWHCIWQGLPRYENINTRNRNKNRQHGLFKAKTSEHPEHTRDRVKKQQHTESEKMLPSYILLRTERHEELLPGILLLNMQPADLGPQGPAVSCPRPVHQWSAGWRLGPCCPWRTRLGKREERCQTF